MKTLSDKFKDALIATAIVCIADEDEVAPKPKRATLAKDCRARHFYDVKIDVIALISAQTVSGPST